MEIRPQYECPCGYKGDYSENHERPGHGMIPLPTEDGSRSVCTGCEGDGCDLSDCVAFTQETGECAHCGAPATVEGGRPC